MSRERRTVFIVSLTLLIYALTQFLESGVFILPFPIFDFILLVISLQFIYWNRKIIFQKKFLYFLFYFLALSFKVFSGQFFLSLIYSDSSIEDINSGVFQDICSLIYFVFSASFFSTWNWNQGKIRSLLLILAFVFLSVTPLFVNFSYLAFLTIPMFVAYLYLTKSRTEFHYLFLLNAILDLMAISMLVRLN